MKSLDKKIQTLNVDINNQVQLLAQQMSDVQKTLAVIMGQKPNIPLPSSSLSDIEIIDVPNKKHS